MQTRPHDDADFAGKESALVLKERREPYPQHKDF
jgi:hypothetical protein